MTIKNSLKLTIVICFSVAILTFLSSLLVVNAQGTSSSGSLGDDETEFDVDNNVELQEIKIPLFDQIELAGGTYATIYSWVSFIGGIASIGLIAFWIFLILKSAFKEVKEEGKAEGQADAFKSLKSTFVGAGLAIAFPISLSILGSIMGLGGLWNWPKALRECPAHSEDYTFYFQARLEKETDAEAEAFCGID